MAIEPDQSGMEAETPIGKFRLRGHDSIVGAILVMCGVVSYALYMHMQESRDALVQIGITNVNVAKAIQEGTKVQRLTACILATKEDQRENQYTNVNSFCNRISN